MGWDLSIHGGNIYILNTHFLINKKDIKSEFKTSREI
jgi:hypothetical protein